MTETQEAQKTPMETLLEQPLENRMVFFVNMLAKLEHQNLTRAGGEIALSRTQADVKCIAKGKAISYRDTINFFVQLFGAELKDKLTPQKEESRIILQ